MTGSMAESAKLLQIRTASMFRLISAAVFPWKGSFLVAV